jgi:hypothetical protein
MQYVPGFKGGNGTFSKAVGSRVSAGCKDPIGEESKRQP